MKQIIILILTISGLHFAQAQKTRASVKNWQQKNGLVADGSFKKIPFEEETYEDSGWVTPPVNDTTESFLQRVETNMIFDLFHDNSILMDLYRENWHKTRSVPGAIIFTHEKKLLPSDTVDYMADTITMDFLFLTRSSVVYHKGFAYIQVFDTIKNGACIVSAIHDTKPKKGQVPASIYEPLPILFPGYYRIRADHDRNQKIKMYLVYKT